MQTPGEILRAEREKKGLSIKDVEQATSIRSLYLTAIEQANYFVIPGEVYVKGFMRNYASFLGLNPQEILDMYRQTQNTPSPGVEQPVSNPSSHQPSTTQKVKENRERTSSSLKWIAIILLFAIGAAGYWWFSTNTPNPAPNLDKSAKPSPVVPSQPIQQLPVTPQPPPQTKPIVLIAKFIDECWTQVFVDGKEVYEGIPKVGETLTWEGQKTVVIRLGNASGADITYNGQPQAKLGAKGEVIEKTFLPKP